jgi:site-specific recombinase XerC
MILYGGRVLNSAAAKTRDQVAETRDAILYDIPGNGICRVQIQGSTELITARFPQNAESAPAWLKPGNAVRITNRGGLRGYIEITGHGQLLTTGVSAPTIPTPADAVLTGCAVVAIPAPT